MSGSNEQVISSLERMIPLREAVMRAAIGALQLPPASRGLDIGCGIGDLTLLLAEATGPDGRVAGLDLSWPAVHCARRRADKSAHAQRIEFANSDMGALPFARGVFDWAWSVDCVGYPAGEILPILEEICRVVRPGGVIALLGWTSQTVLPGHELLEARLNAACTSYGPFLEGYPPRAHFLRALHGFHRAGLTEARCRAFVGLVQGPLGPEIRDGMSSLFDMLWGDAIGQASTADIEEYRRLCSPDSPHFIGDVPEYCAQFTYTMFTARVPARI
ncbi:Methylase involved in ubiquinone/menaquinone biosynthesis [uncultured Desulfatiglans sp.]|nr:Methylase involved in ubiquinone/menaquinone biosynthesis [uncultured Desulfatiglans sp.]